VYLDDEEDQCTISSNEELREAIRLTKAAGRPSLKIFVGTNTIPCASSSDASSDVSSVHNASCNSLVPTKESIPTFTESRTLPISAQVLDSLKTEQLLNEALSEMEDLKREVDSTEDGFLMVEKDEDEDFVKELIKSQMQESRRSMQNSTPTPVKGEDEEKDMLEHSIKSIDAPSPISNFLQTPSPSKTTSEVELETPVGEVAPPMETPVINEDVVKENISTSEPAQENSVPEVIQESNSVEAVEKVIQDDATASVPAPVETVPDVTSTFRTLLEQQNVLAAFALIPQVLQVPEVLRLVSEWSQSIIDGIVSAFYESALMSGKLTEALEAAIKHVPDFSKFKASIVDFFESHVYHSLPPPSLEHSRVTCDGCGMKPILGNRFKCFICPDFDLCNSCYEVSDHHPLHPFILLRNADHSLVIRNSVPFAGDGHFFAPPQNAQQHQNHRHHGRGHHHGRGEREGHHGRRKDHHAVPFGGDGGHFFAPPHHAQQHQNHRHHGRGHHHGRGEREGHHGRREDHHGRREDHDDWKAGKLAKKLVKHALKNLGKGIEVTEEMVNNLVQSVCSTPCPEKISLDIPSSSVSAPSKGTEKSSPQNSSVTAPTMIFNSQFVDHVTIPEGVNVIPETKFTKTWRVQNIGSTAWRSVRLVPVGGSSFQGPAFVDVPNALPNAFVDINVPLVAPPSSGRYVGYWRLINADGNRFGDRIWVDITVNEAAPALVLPSAPVTTLPVISLPSPPAPEYKYGAALQSVMELELSDDIDMWMRYLEETSGDVDQAVGQFLNR
jgi:hypothetical protein